MSQLLSDLRAGGGIVTAVTGGNNITVNMFGTVAQVNVSGTTNHAVQVGNGLGALTSIGLGTAGQILVSGGPFADPSFQTLPTSASSFITNSGTATPNGAGQINIVTTNSTVWFTGAGNTITVDPNRTNNLVFGSSLPALIGGSQNIGVGSLVLNSLISGIGNTAIGFNAGEKITSGSANTAVGNDALNGGAGNITGSSNTGIGNAALNVISSGADNVAVGDNAGASITTGSNNILLGTTAGFNYTTESNNIVLGLTGTIADASVTRIANIYGTTVGVTNAPVVIDNAGKLGTVGGGTGFLTTLTGDSGVATPIANNINVQGTTSGGFFTGSAGNLNLTFNFISLPTTSATNGQILINGSRVLHAFCPGAATASNIFVGTSSGNFTLGNLALKNAGVGALSLNALTSGNNNNCFGYQSGLLIDGGSGNLGLGSLTLDTLTSGSRNIAIGNSSGKNLTTESDNVYIQNQGTVADANVIRIGTTGVGAGFQTSCFISGIDTVNVGSVAKVVTMASDQLGTATITAGVGISVTPGANTITIASTGTTTLTYTNVNATPYVVLATDEYLSVDTSALSITVQLPNAATSGRVFVIKDRSGAAATRNITVTTVGGAVNIDGATTYVMNTNFQSIQVMGNGSTYEIF